MFFYYYFTFPIILSDYLPEKLIEEKNFSGFEWRMAVEKYSRKMAASCRGCRHEL